MKPMVLSILCCLILSPLHGYAQTEPASGNNQVTDEAREFESAVNRYKEDISRLKARRGGVSEVDARVSEFRDNLPSLSVTDLAKVLREEFPQGTAILFYNYDDKRFLRAWVIDHQGIKGYSQSTVSAKEIQTKIDQLRDALGIAKLQLGRAPKKRVLALNAHSSRNATSQAASVRIAIKNLTGLLLPPPIAAALGQTRNAIVVPVLEIGTVPFAVLQPFGAREILIDRMSISFAPSLFDITDEQIEPWSAKFNRPLIVGNPHYTNKGGWELPSLPGSEKEANAVATMMHAKPLIGREATKQTILKQVADADLLYFATHGVGDSIDSRHGSFLVFGATENDLGFWTMAEILNAHQKWGIMLDEGRTRTPLKARLAVLSACQTGVGQTSKGGVLSLGRTMQASGVPRVVMSIWNVSDDATVSLMGRFVSRLQKEVPAEALRQAMLATKKDYPSPADWAAFVYFGLPH